MPPLPKLLLLKLQQRLLLKPKRKEGYVHLGFVLGAHGIRGEIRIRSLTLNPLDIASYGALVDETGAPFLLTSTRGGKKADLIAKVDGVTDRNAAETLQGKNLFVSKEALPELKEDDNAYYSELVGFSLETESGENLGQIKDVFDNNAHGVLDVMSPDGDLFCIPLVEDIFLGIERDEKIAIVADSAKEFLDLSR
ncbi:MAG: ribosome maturation factor RimM [Alphaproteobacteria bacterium]|nr:ribosome maturation factor RimM [Alphaproteobacteria bacterium]